MKFSATVFQTVLFIFSHLEAGGQDIQSCVSPQYCELKKNCVIQCAFETNYYAVYWYNSTDTKSDNPFITLDVDRGKSGSGYLMGEFDILPNGSLFIPLVSRQHEHTFRVMILSSKLSGSPYIEDVDVYLIVAPQQRRPFVTGCNNRSTCYRNVEPSSIISCMVRDSRPAANLKWIQRTAHCDKELSSQKNITLKSSLYTTKIETKVDVLFQSVSLSLLVCQVTSSPITLPIDETPILIFNLKHNIFSRTNVVKMHVLHQKQVQMACPDGNFTMFVWMKKSSDGTDKAFCYVTADSTIIISSPGDYTIGKKGALIILETDFHHEGFYGCLGSNGETEDAKIYETVVYVHPSPPFPVVLGCGDKQYCFLKIETSGTLTCSLQKVRPLINLKWRVPPGSEEYITISDGTQTIKSNKDTFDITLTNSFEVKNEFPLTIPVECISTNGDEDLNTLVTRVDLKLKSVHRSTNHPSTESTEESRMWLMYVGVPVLICAVFTFAMVLKKGYQRRLRQRKKEENDDEGELAVPLHKPSTGDKPEEWKDLPTELKDKYTEICERVLPIPFLSEKLYCVDEVFVDNGLQYLQSGHWIDVPSYKDLFTNLSCTASKRIFIEGNPGYGKTTLVKKVAYDWCSPKEGNVIKKYDILILLNLRQIGRMKSIYKAIKLLLLTRDSKFTEEEIESILRNEQFSVCFIFDGFDEYNEEHIDGTDGLKSDVDDIIQGNMFRSSLVIMTTRTSNLPRIFLPQTVRVRLIEFDDNIRNMYIEKVVIGNNEKSKDVINHHLGANPVLNDICGIPMVFVMFAHLADKGQEIEKLVTVTKLFRFVLSCFFSHLESKYPGKQISQIEHGKLDKLAYNGLREKVEGIYWDKKRVCEIIGNELYKSFADLGILMEEETLEINDNDKEQQSDILVKKKIRFYHKLFSEWFAGNYLAVMALNISREELWSELRQLDYSKHEYVYRFASGQDVEAATKIIRFLYATNTNLQFAMFCVVENIDVMAEFKDIAQALCSDNVVFNADDDIFTQRSLSRVLQVASEQKITIKHVWVRGLIRSVDTARSCVIFNSNVTLPTLRTLQVLHIYEEGKEFQHQEIHNMFAYVNNCAAINEMCFHLCFLPFSLGQNEITLRHSVKLHWYPISTRQFTFNFTTYSWQYTDGESLTQIQYQKEAQVWRSWSMKNLDEAKQPGRI